MTLRVISAKTSVTLSTFKFFWYPLFHIIVKEGTDGTKTSKRSNQALPERRSTQNNIFGSASVKKLVFQVAQPFQDGRSWMVPRQIQGPKNRPTAISEIEKQRIISVRRHLEAQKFAQVGTSTIKWELTKSGLSFPSDRTIHRVLKREGLVKKNCLRSQRCRVPILHWCAWF